MKKKIKEFFIYTKPKNKVLFFNENLISINFFKNIKITNINLRKLIKKENTIYKKEDKFKNIDFYIKKKLIYIEINNNLKRNENLFIINTYLTKNKEKNFLENKILKITKNIKSNIVEINIDKNKQQTLKKNNKIIILNKNSNLKYSLFSNSNYLIKEKNKITIEQKNNSKTLTNFIYTKNKKSDNKIEIYLKKGSQNKLHLLGYTEKNQNKNIKLKINHIEKNSRSNCKSYVITKNKSKCSIYGKIIVNKKSNNVDSKLKLKSIILSNKSIITLAPILEIYNKNIKCSHGAFIGHLDKNSINYMRTKGIDINETKKILISNFINLSIKTNINKIYHYINKAILIKRKKI